MPKRLPISTIRILLRQPEQANRACSIIQNLPIDPEKPIEVCIREAPRARGLDQNALYWVRLGEISEQAWVKGRKYSAEVWHEFMKKNVMPDKVITKDGLEVPKWEEGPDGEVSIISTRLLEKRFFAEYISMIEAHAAQEYGVQFSAREW